jgi:hypothetical protein
MFIGAPHIRKLQQKLGSQWYKLFLWHIYVMVNAIPLFTCYNTVELNQSLITISHMYTIKCGISLWILWMQSICRTFYSLKEYSWKKNCTQRMKLTSTYDVGNISHLCCFQ